MSLDAVAAWTQQGADKALALQQLLDLVQQVCSGTTTTAEALTALSAMPVDERSVSALTDTLALTAVLFEEEGDEHNRLASLIKEVREAGIVSEALLIERLEFGWLEVPSRWVPAALSASTAGAQRGRLQGEDR